MPRRWPTPSGRTAAVWNGATRAAARALFGLGNCLLLRAGRDLARSAWRCARPSTGSGNACANRAAMTSLRPTLGTIASAPGCCCCKHRRRGKFRRGIRRRRPEGGPIGARRRGPQKSASPGRATRKATRAPGSPSTRAMRIIPAATSTVQRPRAEGVLPPVSNSGEAAPMAAQDAQEYLEQATRRILGRDAAVSPRQAAFRRSRSARLVRDFGEGELKRPGCFALLSSSWCARVTVAPSPPTP